MRFKAFITSIVLLSSTFLFVSAYTNPARAETTAELEAQLKAVQAQIDEYTKQIAQTQADKQTLANTIATLKKQQSKISAEIKATSLQIGELDNQLSATGASIDDSNKKLTDAKNQAAAILRVIDEEGGKSFLEMLVGDGGFSAVFAALESLNQLTQDLSQKIEEVKSIKVGLENKYADLSAQQQDKQNLLSIQALQQNTLSTKVSQQNTLLTQTKGKEVTYQGMLADSKKQADEIKSRIYELLGVNTQITFEQAVSIAGWASTKTGVRPAFLLAILTQESNLGKNVGTCNRPFDPPSKSWKVIMKPDRDQAPFIAITKALGRNPDETPVSCPMHDAKGNQIGWGGAMGPAQFIPSTWVLYQNAVSAITGKSPADPWDMRDAFLASALLLKDNGAASGKQNAEWRAAMLYFSGSTNPRFSFYGDNVISLAAQYENDIRAMSGQ